LARRPAIREGKLGARDCRQLRPNKVLGDIEQLHLGKRIAGQGQLDDRNAGGVVDQDDRWRGPRGKLFQNGLRNRCDLRLRGIDVDSRLEEDFDNAHSRKRLRLDVFNIIDRGGEDAFVRRDNSAGHIVRRQAGVAPDDRDDRNADVGENIGRRSDRRKRPENHDQYRHDHESVGTRKG
jgi:hypothetical protein